MATLKTWMNCKETWFPLLYFEFCRCDDLSFLTTRRYPANRVKADCFCRCRLERLELAWMSIYSTREKHVSLKRSLIAPPNLCWFCQQEVFALYEDKTTGNDKNDDHVPPGGSHVYSWKLTNAHAPTDSDDDCLTWIYHSHVLPHKDINTGLLGNLVW